MNISERHVLYVDDEPLMLMATARMLRRLGWKVTTMEKPPESIPDDITVVLADWQPHGPAMVELATRALCPLVVYTGNPEAVARDDLHVVDKPASTEILDAALNHATRI